MISKPTFSVLLLTGSLLLPGVAQAVESAHLPSADVYMTVTPANNDYLFSSEGGGILQIVSNVVTAKVVCGAFVGRVFKNQWPELSQTVMQGLFGGPSNDANQGLPNSSHWYDAIASDGTASPWTYASGGKTYRLARLGSFFSGGAIQLQPGMVLVSKYAGSGDTTGHTMLVRGAVTVTNPGNAPAGTTTTLRVNVWDSTKTEHTSNPGSVVSLIDSRAGKESGGAFDQGAGTGNLLVFLDTNGQPIGWTWGIQTNAAVRTSTILAGTFMW